MRIVAVGKLCAWLLLIGATASVQASVFTRETFESLSRRSEAVVHAKVTDIDSQWNQARSMIFTRVTLQVIDVIQGHAGRRIVLRLPGGTVGDDIIKGIGLPEFAPGEEVVVFVARWRDGVPMIAGYSEGVSRVEPEGNEPKTLRGGVADGMTVSDVAGRLHGGRP